MCGTWVGVDFLTNSWCQIIKYKLWKTFYAVHGDAPSTKYFNQTGRANPNVSAYTVDFAIYYWDVEIHVSGTSCAAPTFSGNVSLLNDIHLNSNQPTLGFIYPLLYGKLMGKGFIDINKGEVHWRVMGSRLQQVGIQHQDGANQTLDNWKH